MTATEQTITFAELRDGDTLVDKSGNRWLVLGFIATENTGVMFWLADPVTKIKTHLMQKSGEDPCTVLRTPTHADELAQREAEVDAAPKSLAPLPAGGAMTTSDSIESSTMSSGLSPTASETTASDDAGQAEVVEQLGAVTIAEVTAAETDAANAATVDAPIELPAFSSLNDLEMRSHLYLLHGVYGDDIQPRAYLIALHDKTHQAHADGFLNARFRPHVHAEATA